MANMAYADRRSYVAMGIDSNDEVIEGVIIWKPIYDDQCTSAFNTSDVGTAYALNSWELTDQCDNATQTFPSFTFSVDYYKLVVFEMPNTTSLSTLWTNLQNAIGETSVTSHNDLTGWFTGWEQGDFLSLADLNQDSTSNAGEQTAPEDTSPDNYGISIDGLALVEDTGSGGSAILQGISWSALLPTTDGTYTSKDILINNVSGNTDAYITALLNAIDSKTIRGVYTHLKNNETI